MAVASDAQVQEFSNRVRMRCDQIRALYLGLKQDRAQFDDVYAALTQQSPTFTDGRVDVPVKAVPGDILAWNTFAARFVDFVEGALTDQNKNEGAAQYPVIQKLGVRVIE